MLFRIAADLPSSGFLKEPTGPNGLLASGGALIQSVVNPSNPAASAARRELRDPLRR
jgi:hypothetical protein